MAAKTLKKSVSLTDSEAQTFLEGEEIYVIYRLGGPFGEKL